MENIFYKNPEDYDDKLKPIKFYQEQAAQMIATMKGISYEEAMKLATVVIKKNFKDRQIKFFLRKENGDRELRNCGFAGYISTHVKQGNVIAPSMTTYLAEKVQPSMLSEYNRENIKLRSQDKREGQDAKAAGDMELAAFKNGSQNNRKTKNNSATGLYNSTGSVINNPTNHSTLTSITRTMTSLTNANNERLISGNRGYFTPRDVFNAVVNESTYCNKELIKEAIVKFNLHVPTVDEVVECLKSSSDMYCKDDHYYNKFIIPYLSKLKGEELAGILYTLDLYHLGKYNPDFLKTMLTKLSYKCTEYPGKLDDFTKMFKVEQAITYFAHNIFVNEVKGYGKDYEKMNEEQDFLNNLYHTCLHIEEVLMEYKLYFNAFFMVNISPINSHRMQYMRRKNVLLSDTDSSGFSTDEIIKFIYGEFVVNADTIGLTGAITYLSSENIVHQLSRLSSTMNVDKNEIRRLAMKNEWYWSSFTPIDVSKHYYAEASIQEGNVFPTSEMEIKGVHLKSSLVPKDIIAKGNAIMKEYSNSIAANKPMKLDDIIARAIGIELEIRDSMLKGETRFLKSNGLNPPEAYKKDVDKSPYGQHIFWEEVFASKYGSLPEPPYRQLKFPTILNNKTALTEWVDSIKDVQLQDRLRKWIARTKKTNLNNIHIHMDYINDKGLPEEIRDIVDTEKVIFDMTTQLRNIMSSYGILVEPSRLLKDQFNIDL